MMSSDPYLYITVSSNGNICDLNITGWHLGASKIIPEGTLNFFFSCYHHAVCNLSSHWLWQLPVLKPTDPSSICILDLEGATLKNFKNLFFPFVTCYVILSKFF